MSDQHREEIKRRVAKLLNLAGDDAAAEGEIENALRFARRLMEQHHIDQDELDQSDQQPADDFDRERFQFDRRAVATWEDWLIACVTAAIPTVQFYSEGTKQKRSKTGLLAFNGAGQPDTRKVGTYMFYGPGADVSIAVDLFRKTRDVVATIAVGRYGGVYRGEGRSYAEGFALGMMEAIKAQAMKRTSDERAIVLRSTAVVKKSARGWLASEHDVKLRNVGSSSPAGQHYSGAHSQGRADGREYGKGTKTGGAGRIARNAGYLT